MLWHAEMLCGRFETNLSTAQKEEMQGQQAYSGRDRWQKEKRRTCGGERAVLSTTWSMNGSGSTPEGHAENGRYESLKAAKLSEIKAGEDQKDTKTQELADTDAKNAQVQHHSGSR